MENQEIKIKRKEFEKKVNIDNDINELKKLKNMFENDLKNELININKLKKRNWKWFKNCIIKILTFGKIDKNKQTIIDINKQQKEINKLRENLSNINKKISSNTPTLLNKDMAYCINNNEMPVNEQSKSHIINGCTIL